VGQGAPFERDVILYIYKPPRIQQPYLYFDTSRFAPYRRQNPPEFPSWPVYPDTVNPLVRAYVRWRPNLPQTTPENLDFIEPKKFQVLAAGTDDDWGTLLPDDGSIVFPDGPYAGLYTGHADNLVNFSQSTLEDSQP
jgi:hypothetical protein